jgi:poly(A) polymerase
VITIERGGALARLALARPTLAEAVARARDARQLGAAVTALLVGPTPADDLRALARSGALGRLLPEIDALRPLRPDGREKDLFAHTTRVVEGTPARPALRWAALLHDVGKPATRTRVGGAVHFPDHEVVGARIARATLAELAVEPTVAERATRLVALHGRANAYEAAWTESATRRLMTDAGDAETLADLVALSAADATSARPDRVDAAWRRAEALAARCRAVAAADARAAERPPLDGHALMALVGRPAGPWLGQVQRHLLALVRAGALAPDDRAGAEAAARSFLEESG